MGVLLIEHNNNYEQIIKTAFCDEMIERFEKLSSSVHEDCNNIQSRILEEIAKIEKVKETTNESLKLIDESQESDLLQAQLDEAVDSVISLIEKRTSLPEYKQKQLQPLGKEFYEMKCGEFNITMELLLTALEEKGYDTQTLLELDMNPEVVWRGTVESSDQMYAKKSI